MKTLLIIALVIVVAVVIIVIVLKAFTSTDQLAQDASRPANEKKPTQNKPNDKLIVVSNATYDDIKKALTQFCNIYNKDDFAALPRLWHLSNNSFAVTFPYDTDFATYCFAVNFLKYPINIKWHSEVRAWATTKPGDDWITDKNVNKSVMLYLADDDKEYDNVFLTTSDNIGYKLGFAAGEEKQLLGTPKKIYEAPMLNISSLTNQEHEDFE